jgi:heme A synthase
MRRSTLAAVLALCFLAGVNGCSITAHDPANQKAINNRQRVNACWQGYAAAVRTVDQLYKGGAMSKADATTARNVLVKDVRPLIETAQDAVVNGNPEAAILNAERALQGVVDSLNTKKATTRPASLRLDERHRVPNALAA